MKLYRVPIEFEVYVLAEDDTEAMHTANNCAREELNNIFSPAGFPTEITNISQVDHDALDSIPYTDGGDGDLTIEEIFEQMEQERRNQLQKEAHDLNQLPLQIKEDADG